MPQPKELGRATARLADVLRQQIEGGGLSGPMPTERELARTHGVARATAARALDLLEAEGLVACAPRHGHRILARAHDPARGAPLAYVRAATRDSVLQGLHGILVSAMQALAGERGWSLLVLSSQDRPPAEVFEQLRSSRACGAMLDTLDAELLGMVERAGMPAVMIESWREGVGIDSVIQDSFHGAVQAARHLAARGHRRIGWLGGLGENYQSRERLYGALAGLAETGLDIAPELRVAGSRSEDEQRARAMLARPDRPTAVLALWRTAAIAVARAAADLGLQLGRDLEVVGWTSEEQYEGEYRAGFGAGPVPPAVVWSARTMAEAAMTRLVQRRTNPGMAPVQIRVPTRLRLAEEESEGRA